jgi:outer membrane protein insertion porin family
VELPIIENILFKGIKAKKIEDEISKDLKLKERSSFNQIDLIEDKQNILKKLKNIGYFNSTIETYLEDLNDNRVKLIYNINLGDKAKIKKISFIGDKVYKNRKLKI